MRRLFTLTFFCGILSFVYAQKRYISFYVIPYASSEVYLSGAIPPTMKSCYRPSDFGKEGWRSCLGDLLNLFVDNGFTVEQMNTASTSTSSSTSFYSIYLLSKSSTDSDTSDATPNMNANTGNEITEVARYNLQGMPVEAHEKGLQIVVYSNYTTKTVIVE